jgi:hypothetical protein
LLGGGTDFLQKDSVVGLGAKPGRAGSIGWETPGHGEVTDPPSQEAGDSSLCPIHGEITASWFQAEWTGAQTMGTPGILVELSSFKLVYRYPVLLDKRIPFI